MEIVMLGVAVSLLASVVCFIMVIRWRSIVRLNIKAHGKTADILRKLTERVVDNTESARICRDILRRHITDED
jgi:signal transduction histidine kinase